ncbi:trimeric intracellular cation channel family protein [Agrococcus sp. HG114]|uniref:trimeric intracellular cation channel family protein n=1 Tax=Agrococcus sp. HG114 TaxID=2969757 RepID=UPI00215A8B3A|nr:trimeric intracellular cation channel family protein [Agrococcus sp. HG114]MCR8669681.1 trimeric intracellular cation channel family protein [Agrococcus sp. HG114]
MLDEPVGWLSAVGGVLNAVGIVAFAVSGALLAVQKRMDVVGMAGLAVVTATGGGMLRDLLLGATPVAVLRDWWMIGLALLGALAVFLLHRWMQRLDKPVLVFDAIGLGIFVVGGATKAVHYGLDPVGAAFVGMLTGIGGGILRDALANDIPAVFRRESRLYLLPALLGSSAAAAAEWYGWGHWAVLTAIAATVCAVRIASEVLDWRVPSLRTESIPTLGDRGRD